MLGGELGGKRGIHGDLFLEFEDALVVLGFGGAREGPTHGEGEHRDHDHRGGAGGDIPRHSSERGFGHG